MRERRGPGMYDIKDQGKVGKQLTFSKQKRNLYKLIDLDRDAEDSLDRDAEDS